VSKKTIWKYPMPIVDYYAFDMPEDAEVLTVQVQHGVPCIWATVDPNKPKLPRGFFVRGTGHELGLAESAKYVGTFQIELGGLVFHLFDEGPQR